MKMPRYIPRSKEDWKYLFYLSLMVVGLALIIIAGFLAPILKLWALLKYVLS